MFQHGNGYRSAQYSLDLHFIFLSLFQSLYSVFRVRGLFMVDFNLNPKYMGNFGCVLFVSHSEILVKEALY